jgi:hypothetical protein
MTVRPSRYWKIKRLVLVSPAWKHHHPDGRLSYITGAILDLVGESRAGTDHGVHLEMDLDQARQLRDQLDALLKRHSRIAVWCSRRAAAFPLDRMQALSDALLREAEEAGVVEGQNLVHKTPDGYEVSVGPVKARMPQYEWGMMIDTDGLRAEAAERAGNN